MPAASTVYILVVLSVLVHVTLADFDLYHCSGHQLLETGPPPSILVPRYIDEWKVADGDKLPTSRDKIDFNAGWGPSKDVSHGRHGVRCEGSCDYKDEPSEINVVEMHFTTANPLYHFTIYKDRGSFDKDGRWRWIIYDTDGYLHGSCFPEGGFSWTYDWPEYHNAHLEGNRKFRCLTEFSAYDINFATNKEDPNRHG